MECKCAKIKYFNKPFFFIHCLPRDYHFFCFVFVYSSFLTDKQTGLMHSFLVWIHFTSLTPTFAAIFFLKLFFSKIFQQQIYKNKFLQATLINNFFPAKYLIFLINLTTLVCFFFVCFRLQSSVTLKEF